MKTRQEIIDEIINKIEPNFTEAQKEMLRDELKSMSDGVLFQLAATLHLEFQVQS